MFDYGNISLPHPKKKRKTAKYEVKDLFLWQDVFHLIMIFSCHYIIHTLEVELFLFIWQYPWSTSSKKWEKLLDPKGWIHSSFFTDWCTFNQSMKQISHTLCSVCRSLCSNKYEWGRVLFKFIYTSFNLFFSILWVTLLHESLRYYKSLNLPLMLSLCFILLRSCCRWT